MTIESYRDKPRPGFTQWTLTNHMPFTDPDAKFQVEYPNTMREHEQDAAFWILIRDRAWQHGSSS